MTQQKKSDGRQAGFTLIELLVVMVIMGVLVALVGPNLLGQVDKAKPKAARTQIENFATAVEMFKLDIGRYPKEGEGLEALRKDPARVARWDGPYMKKNIPKDPWDKAYVYRTAGREFDIISYGADGVEGGSGLDSDIRSSE
jgi:general secretion pathway protein G